MTINNEDSRTKTMLDAVKAGDLATVIELKNSGVDVNTKNSFNENLLFIACHEGHEEIVIYLLEHQADIHQLNTGNHSIMDAACIGGNVEIVKRLIAAGVDPNQTMHRFNRLPVFFSYKYNHPQIFRYFVENNLLQADDLKKMWDYHSYRKPADIIQFIDIFVSHYPDINEEYVYGIFRSLLTTQFSPAVKKGLDYLLKKYPYIKKNFGLFLSDLVNQSMMGPHNPINYLKKIPNLNPLLSEYEYAFIFAKPENKILQYLLKNDLAFETQDPNGQTLLHLAAAWIKDEYDHVFHIKCLLDLGYPINMLNSQHQTPLHVAIQKGLFFHAIALVIWGADLSIKDHEGLTPIERAAFFCEENHNPDDTYNIKLKTDLLKILVSNDF